MFSDSDDYRSEKSTSEVQRMQKKIDTLYENGRRLQEENNAFVKAIKMMVGDSFRNEERNTIVINPTDFMKLKKLANIKD